MSDGKCVFFCLWLAAWITVNSCRMRPIDPARRFVESSLSPKMFQVTTPQKSGSLWDLGQVSSDSLASTSSEPSTGDLSGNLTSRTTVRAEMFLRDCDGIGSRETVATRSETPRQRAQVLRPRTSRPSVGTRRGVCVPSRGLAGSGLVQTSPARPGASGPGSYAIIDLDLSRCERLASRFGRGQRESLSLLKSGIDTRSRHFSTSSSGASAGRSRYARSAAAYRSHRRRQSASCPGK